MLNHNVCIGKHVVHPFDDGKIKLKFANPENYKVCLQANTNVGELCKVEVLDSTNICDQSVNINTFSSNCNSHCSSTELTATTTNRNIN